MKLRFPASLRVIGRSVVDWWDSWLDMVLMTVLWFIAQITVVLGPPATFGYYYAVYHLMSGQSLGVHGLIEGARLYFGKAWLWGSVNIIAIFVTSFAGWFYFNVKAAWGFYAEILVLMIGYLWLCTQFYGLPYFMAMEEKDLYTALKNGLLTSLAAPFFTFMLMLFATVVLVFSFGAVLPLFLGLPGIVPALGFRGVYDRLVAFGLREREKTPREIETEQAGKIVVPVFDRQTNSTTSVRDDSPAPGGDIVDSEGQVEQKK
jgi:hypothetical protein